MSLSHVQRPSSYLSARSAPWHISAAALSNISYNKLVFARLLLPSLEDLFAMRGRKAQDLEGQQELPGA